MKKPRSVLKTISVIIFLSSALIIQSLPLFAVEDPTRFSSEPEAQQLAPLEKVPGPPADIDKPMGYVLPEGRGPVKPSLEASSNQKSESPGTDRTKQASPNQASPSGIASPTAASSSQKAQSSSEIPISGRTSVIFTAEGSALGEEVVRSALLNPGAEAKITINGEGEFTLETKFGNLSAQSPGDNIGGKQVVINSINIRGGQGEALKNFRSGKGNDQTIQISGKLASIFDLAQSVTVTKATLIPGSSIAKTETITDTQKTSSKATTDIVDAAVSAPPAGGVETVSIPINPVEPDKTMKVQNAPPIMNQLAKNVVRQFQHKNGQKLELDTTGQLTKPGQFKIEVEGGQAKVTFAKGTIISVPVYAINGNREKLVGRMTVQTQNTSFSGDLGMAAKRGLYTAWSEDNSALGVTPAQNGSVSRIDMSALSAAGGNPGESVVTVGEITQGRGNQLSARLDVQSGGTAVAGIPQFGGFGELPGNEGPDIAIGNETPAGQSPTTNIADKNINDMTPSDTLDAFNDLKENGIAGGQTVPSAPDIANKPIDGMTPVETLDAFDDLKQNGIAGTQDIDNMTPSETLGAYNSLQKGGIAGNAAPVQTTLDIAAPKQTTPPNGAVVMTSIKRETILTPTVPLIADRTPTPSAGLVENAISASKTGSPLQTIQMNLVISPSRRTNPGDNAVALIAQTAPLVDAKPSTQGNGTILFFQGNLSSLVGDSARKTFNFDKIGASLVTAQAAKNAIVGIEVAPNQPLRVVEFRSLVMPRSNIFPIDNIANK